MDATANRQRGVGATVAVALLAFPPFALPIYLVGAEVRGIFVFVLSLSVGLPAAASVFFARVRGLGWVAAVVLGITSGALSVGVLIASLVVYCSSRTCFS